MGIKLPVQDLSPVKSAVTNVLIDGGYTGQPFADAVHNLLGATVTLVIGEVIHGHLAAQSYRYTYSSLSFLIVIAPPDLWKNPCNEA